jgi:phage shock protein E
MNIQELINDNNTTIVDVRTEDEFAEGNVNGSINIPLHEVVDRMEELKEMQPLVLCCLSGGRSGQATAFLQAQGCEDVHNGGGWEMVKAQKA